MRMRRCATRPGLAATTVLVVAGLLLLLGSTVVGVATAPDADAAVGTARAVETDTQAAGDELSAVDAIVLGIVEGVTEFLPISSTGHLIVAERILDVGQDDSTEEAMDAYTVIIQVGAILAVLLLYRHRVRDMALGLVGRSESGRKVAIAVAVAVLPAVVIALAFEGVIKDQLLAVGPSSARGSRAGW